MLAAAVLFASISPSAGEASLLAELERLERRLAESEARLVALVTEEEELAAELGEVAAGLGAEHLRAQETQAVLARRVRALARLPAGARLLLLGSASSLHDYLSMRRVLRWVAAHDQALHAGHVSTRRRLEALEADLDGKRRRLEALVAEERAVRDRVAKEREARVAWLAERLADKRTSARLWTEQAQARGAVLEAVRRARGAPAQAGGFARRRGKLAWPATGRVTEAFGQRLESAFGTATASSGISIAAAAGSPVIAVAPGSVVFADWLAGYGRVVILDHGDGYHTLAAHLETVAVQVGMQVDAGAVIGTVGDSGSLAGTRLYFEVRRAGAPEDPGGWLRR